MQWGAWLHKLWCQSEVNNLKRLIQFSGSTVCTVLFNGTKVYCANAGDSRAIKVSV